VIILFNDYNNGRNAERFNTPFQRSYKTIQKQAVAEIIEKKSRFIAHSAPASEEQQAIDFISQIKSKYYDATHNVYAYILRDNNIMRYSDDGEPSGTAGVPTLEVLRKEGIVDAVVVITRYFGGTMLGAGGLVRAYTKSAKCGIDASGILQRIFCNQYTLNTEYIFLSKIQKEISSIGCILGEITYTNRVFINVSVPYYIKNFEDKITDISNGQVIIKKQIEGSFIDVI